MRHHDANVELRFDVPLFGGQPEPACRREIVRLDAAPELVHRPQVVLGASLALGGREPVPSQCLGVVTDAGAAGGIHHA